ncbi:unnamed protein product [Lampetra planeri]
MTSARPKRPREVRDMWRAFSQEAAAGDGVATAHHIATDHVVFGRTRGNQEGKGVEVSMSSYSAELSHAARTGDVVERPGSLLHAEVLRRELEAARHRIAVLERSNKHLQADKEFLQSVLSKGGQTSSSNKAPLPKRCRPTADADASPPPSPGDSQSSSSSDTADGTDPEAGRHACPPGNYHRGCRKASKGGCGKEGLRKGIRVKSVEDVVWRYKKVLSVYQKTRSVKRACEKMNVDRNTIALTAPIVDLEVVSPGLYAAVGPYDGRTERLLDFSRRCWHAMDEETRVNVDKMKAEGKLLPISYKFKRMAPQLAPQAPQ